MKLKTEDTEPRKRGRPKVDDSARLSHVLQLRLNDVQRSYLVVLAASWECSLGEAVRRCVDEHLDADIPSHYFENITVEGKPATLRHVLQSMPPNPEWIAEQLADRQGGTD